MPKQCPNCGQNYEIEPGFFYGAMYVNYAASIAIAVGVFAAMYILGSPWEVYEYLIGISIALMVLAPITFRLSRAVWINMFVSYKKPEKKSS